MDNYLAQAKAQAGILGANMQAASNQAAQERYFVNARNIIAIGNEAGSATQSLLKATLDRLGIESMYGCVRSSLTEPAPSGDIAEITGKLSDLVDMIRELRGLAETLEARL